MSARIPLTPPVRDILAQSTIVVVRLPAVLPAPATLMTVAQEVTTLATATQAQITRARLEAELRTKKRATTPQAEPMGLFAQTQGCLL